MPCGGDEAAAQPALGDALASLREPWEAEITARNLRLIREAREHRVESVTWANEIEDELLRKSKASVSVHGSVIR